MGNSIDDIYLEPEDDEIFYECFSCGWYGKECFSQEMTLFDNLSDEDYENEDKDDDGITYLCPECGSYIS